MTVINHPFWNDWRVRTHRTRPIAQHGKGVKDFADKFLKDSGVDMIVTVKSDLKFDPRRPASARLRKKRIQHNQRRRKQNTSTLYTGCYPVAVG